MRDDAGHSNAYFNSMRLCNADHVVSKKGGSLNQEGFIRQEKLRRRIRI